MKTLDEVVKSYEISNGNKDCSQCPYDDECYDHHVCECYERMADTYHYLKEYQERLQNLQDMMDRYDIRDRNYQEAVQNCEMVQMKYQQLLDDFNDNPALSWDALKLMEGKPVWIEHLKDGVVYKAGWCLIVQVDDSLPDIPCVGLVDTDADYRNLEVEWMDMGQWQAYRKERA